MMKATYWTIGMMMAAALAQADTYNVKNYGATPSAPGDDTAGIQAALDAADTHAGADVVYVPAGDYYVNQLMIGSDTTLLGDGCSGTAISQVCFNNNVSAGSSILRNKDAANGNTGIVIEKLRINGRKAQQTNAYIHLTNFRNVAGLTARNCDFRNGSYIGFVAQGDNSLDSNTRLFDCVSINNERFGFYLQSMNKIQDGFKDVQYTRCSSLSNGGGNDAYLCSNIRYTDCLAQNNGFQTGSTAFNVQGFTTDSGRDIVWIRCKSIGNAYHGFTSWIGLRHPKDLVYIDCQASNNGDIGFRISNAEHVSYTDCITFGNKRGYHILFAQEFSPGVVNVAINGGVCRDNREHGISLSGVQDGWIGNVLVRNNGTDLANHWSGIRIENGLMDVPDAVSRNIVITQNSIFNSGTTNQRYGVQSAQDTDYITLTNNDLTPNATAGYSLVGTHNTVSGNN